jgi:hypothetical protein
MLLRAIAGYVSVTANWASGAGRGQALALRAPKTYAAAPKTLIDAAFLGSYTREFSILSFTLVSLEGCRGEQYQPGNSPIAEIEPSATQAPRFV